MVAVQPRSFLRSSRPLRRTPLQTRRVGAGRRITSTQASRGQAQFAQTCMTCHTVAQHTGRAFGAKWVGTTLNELFELISTTMPEIEPGSLKPEQYASIVAFFLKESGYPEGQRELPSVAAALEKIRVEPLGNKLNHTRPFSTSIDAATHCRPAESPCAPLSRPAIPTIESLFVQQARQVLKVGEHGFRGLGVCFVDESSGRRAVRCRPDHERAPAHRQSRANLPNANEGAGGRHFLLKRAGQALPWRQRSHAWCAACSTARSGPADPRDVHPSIVVSAYAGGRRAAGNGAVLPRCQLLSAAADP